VLNPITQSLAYPLALLGEYFSFDLPNGNQYPIGTPVSTVDKGLLYWSGTVWGSTPPIFIGGSPPNITVAPSGTLPATTLGYNPLGLSVVSSSDNAADLTGNGTNIPSLMLIQQIYGGSNINDGRNGLSIFTDLVSPTSPTNAYRFYVGMSAYSKAQVSDNGTAGSPQGIVEAVTGSSQLNSGATNYFALIGGEFTVSADVGSSVAKKAILNLDNWPTDVVQGSVIDTHIWSTAHTGATGCQTWAQIDANAGKFPITSTGTVIKLISNGTIATGFDYGQLAITGNVLQWSNAAYFLGGTSSPTCNLPQASFTNSAGGIALTATGGANQYSALIKGSATSGQSFGLRINGGTTSADVAFDIQNQTGSADYFILFGDGHMQMGVPAGTNGLTMSSIGAINILAPFGSSAAALTSNGSPNNWAGIFLGSTTSGQSQGLLVKAGTTSADLAFDVQNQTGGTHFFQIGGTGLASFSNAVGVNGATPPAQVTGWGTPTGASVVANFSGSASLLTTCSAAIAEIITYLKARGDFGA
jgi:hypothetical protein